jgi:exosortase/archaeosortase family protein
MSFYDKNKDIIWFLGKLSLLCGFYFLWFKTNVWSLPVISTLYGHFIHYLLKFLIEPSVWMLNLMGFEAVVAQTRQIDMFDLEFNIFVRNYCLGVDMFYCFVALIISFPGKWKERIWFIPLGILGIHTINIIRVIALCLSWLKWGTDGPIDHHDVYNVVAVTFIFLMFVVWVNRYKKEPAR